MAVRPEGANHQWRRNPPRELSIDLVADERPGRVTGRAGASCRHAAAEAAISLGHFETDIAAAEHDQTWRQVAELQRLDVGKRPSRLETANGRNCRVRSDVEENLVARQRARAAVIQLHFERFRRDKAPASHDQLAASRIVVVQMQRNFAIDHVLLALAEPSPCRS